VYFTDNRSQSTVSGFCVAAARNAANEPYSASVHDRKIFGAVPQEIAEVFELGFQSIKLSRAEPIPMLKIYAEGAYQKQYGQRERPSARGEGRASCKPHVSLGVKVNEPALELQARADGALFLITDLSARDYSGKRVLETYKFQPFLEKRHSEIGTGREGTPDHPPSRCGMNWDF
jgi:hypothetical protein